MNAFADLAASRTKKNTPHLNVPQLLPHPDLPIPIHIQIASTEQHWAVPALLMLPLHPNDAALKTRHSQLGLSSIHYPCPVNIQFLPTPQRSLLLRITNNYYPTLGTLFRWRMREYPTVYNRNFLR